MIFKFLTFLFPWFLRRRILEHLFKYEIHPNARIGFAWVFPKKLKMAAGASIDHFTFAIHLDLIDMHKDAAIGRGNWITGFPKNSNSRHFQHQQDRQAMLLIGEAASITKNHHLDCTNKISIGRFATIAGYNSQFLTHSISLSENLQHSAPINIGEYTFVGTNVVVLGGAVLPPRSVLGAKSLLNKAHYEDWTLYGGVPAKAISKIPMDFKYFTRLEGFVY